MTSPDVIQENPQVHSRSWNNSSLGWAEEIHHAHDRISDVLRVLPSLRLGRMEKQKTFRTPWIYPWGEVRIRLTKRKRGKTQPIEYASDTGYQHVGISIKSEKHEYVHRQYDMLANETERHNDCRKYRRTRRNHLRYRKPRFNNRKPKQAKGEVLAPSLQYGIMGLYATAYGKPYDATNDIRQYTASELARGGYNCVHAKGGNGCYLRNDEVVYFSESAMCLNYIVVFE